MAKRSKKNQKTQANLEELVIVTFAEDLEHARDYETLLKNNDIPAIIKENHNSEQVGVNNIVVMVPEDYLDEAHVVIESQDAYDDFFDLTMEDDGVDDFESSIFEEEF